MTFIHDVLTTVSPSLGHALIMSLTVPDSPAYIANNESLQLIYIECINDCLEMITKLKCVDSLDQDSSYDSQYESDQPTSGQGRTQAESERLTVMIYTLLALMDPTQDMVRLTKKIDGVFHTLLKMTCIISPQVKVQFETGRIYASLIGRSSPFLIKRLHDVEEYLRIHPGVDDTNIPMATDQSSSKELPLQLNLDCGRSLRESKAEWRTRFYEALYDNKHILEAALEAGLQLVLTKQLQDLSDMIHHPDHTPLRPVLLLMGWDKYPAVGSGKELLDVLWPAEVLRDRTEVVVSCGGGGLVL